jgi:predicted Zn-dependent peptidase
MIGELTSEVFYGGTKYARRPASRTETAAITVDDLKSYYTSSYSPAGAIIGVTGDVKVGELKAKLEKAFGSWKGAGTAAMLPSAEFQGKADPHIYLIDRPGSAQSVLQFGALAVKQTDPDFIALVVANRILGGGSSGRLFQNIREKKGYTYGAYSSLAAQPYPAVWGANASVRTEVTEPAVGEFFKEFTRLQNELVPDAELNDAKRSIIGGFALTLQNPEGILARNLEQVQNDLPANYWDTYAEKINAVTPADVQRVAKKYLGGRPIQLLVVGERKQIEPGLAKYGPVTIVDPAKIAEVSNLK